MPHLARLQPVQLPATEDLMASRPPMSPKKLIDLGDEAMIHALQHGDDDLKERLRAELGFVANGVRGHYHQGKIAEILLEHAVTMGSPLAAFDVDTFIMKVNYVRRRTPALALTAMRAQALLANTADGRDTGNGQ